jgi:sulfur carrier protein
VRVTANGRSFEAPDETTVEGFIRLRGLDPLLVVVELNGEALERPRYAEARLSDGDRLELVRAVAGG